MTTNERCARESGDGVEKLFLCDFFGIDNVVGLANGPYGLDGQDSSASDIAGMDKRKCHMWITEKTDLSAPQQRDNATEHGTVARAIKHARRMTVTSSCFTLWRCQTIFSDSIFARR